MRFVKIICEEEHVQIPSRHVYGGGVPEWVVSRDADASKSPEMRENAWSLSGVISPSLYQT